MWSFRSEGGGKTCAGYGQTKCQVENTDFVQIFKLTTNRGHLVPEADRVTSLCASHEERVMILCAIIFICLGLSKPAHVSAVVCACNKVCKARFVFITMQWFICIHYIVSYRP